MMIYDLIPMKFQKTFSVIDNKLTYLKKAYSSECFKLSYEKLRHNVCSEYFYLVMSYILIVPVGSTDTDQYQ